MKLIMKCSRCGKKRTYSAAGMLENKNYALLKATRAGWHVGETAGDDLCPSCKNLAGVDK